jgi:YggT family protein
MGPQQPLERAPALRRRLGQAPAGPRPGPGRVILSGAMIRVVANFVSLLAALLWVLILLRVLMSWTNPTGGGAFTAFVYQATEPILAPIRRVLPPTGGFDWSPLVAILLLSVITRFVAGL